uniref:Uncharacterized protein n=1 Tax=Eutreptiella gymnastica TaxID=73025 RepID=A0A7S4LFS9_9EUGL
MQIPVVVLFFGSDPFLFDFTSTILPSSFAVRAAFIMIPTFYLGQPLSLSILPPLQLSFHCPCDLLPAYLASPIVLHVGFNTVNSVAFPKRGIMQPYPCRFLLYIFASKVPILLIALLSAPFGAAALYNMLHWLVELNTTSSLFCIRSATPFSNVCSARCVLLSWILTPWTAIRTASRFSAESPSALDQDWGIVVKQ